MSGAIVVAHRALFEERFGRETIARALATLPAEARDELAAALPSTWVRLTTVEAVYGAVAAEVGRDVADVHREIGALGIERTLRTLWRVLLRLTSDNALVSRTPIFFSKSFDRGRLEARITGPGTAELTLHEWPEVGEFPLRSLCNGVAAVLGIAGRAEVSVRVLARTSDGARVAATWRT